MALGRSLTDSAELNVLPHYTADGSELYWLQSDGYRQAHVRAMPVGGTVREARDVVQIDAMGPFDVLADGSLVYEQGRLYRTVYGYEDLFRWDASTKQTVRLTTGRRARDPSVSPDERRVAYSQNEHSESVLAVMDLAPGAEPSILWRGQRYDQAHQPQWSPDGTRIAFSAWRHGGYRDILVVDVATKQVQDITRDRALDMHPSWSPDGAFIYFSSDRTGISNVYAYELATQATWQVTNVLGGAYEPRLSPDGTRLAVIESVPAGGYDLYELVVDRTAWTQARDYVDDRPDAVDVKDDEAAVTAPRDYRAAETLAPQSWTLSLDATTNVASISTGGSDAAGLHGWSLGVGLDLDRGDVNVGASYGYFKYLTPLRVAMSRTLAERGGWRIDGVNTRYREEDWSGTVSVGIPFESRPWGTWAFSFDYDVDWFRLVDAPVTPLDPNMRVPVIPATDYWQAGLATRMSFSTVKGVTFGVGSQSGFDGSVGIRVDHPALGATYKNVTVTYGADRFQRLWGRTPTLSLRLVGAFRAGDLLRLGGFGLGGIGPQDIAQAIINSTRSSDTGYLRGYPSRTVAGNQYHLLNAEYRQELLQVEHGLATLPIYLRRLHLAVLADAGTAFDGPFDAERDLRVSLGAALRLDAFFGYFVPGTFEIGYAHGLTSEGISETWLLLTSSL